DLGEPLPPVLAWKIEIEHDQRRSRGVGEPAPALQEHHGLLAVARDAHHGRDTVLLEDLVQQTRVARIVFDQKEVEQRSLFLPAHGESPQVGRERRAEWTTSYLDLRGPAARRSAERDAPALDRVFDGAQKLLGVLLPLDEVFLRSELRRVEGEALFPKAAQDHDRNAGRGLADTHDGLRAEG